jgi:hypothetical protein
MGSLNIDDELTMNENVGAIREDERMRGREDDNVGGRESERMRI